ncbi:aminoglycoside 6-adenylyltransferase [Sporosarcina sp. ANT_H38]|nr:aminoglycoside 6-adenylyltransferase [Sporosarcina sp. ANT_H38]
MDKLTYGKLLEEFVLFAQEDENIRAVLIVGSRARKEMPADKWSDLDLVIFANNPQSLLVDEKWLLKIAKVHITFLENTAVGGGTERRVLFEEGLDVDFAIFSVSSLSVLERKSEVIRVLSKGVRVLIDKDSLTTSILQKSKDENNIDPGLEAAEVNNLINDFWYHAVLASKKIRRGELLDGKSICDSYMKNLLILLVKTQTKLKKGADFDTWHGFRFLKNGQILTLFKHL